MKGFVRKVVVKVENAFYYYYYYYYYYYIKPTSSIKYWEFLE